MGLRRGRWVLVQCWLAWMLMVGVVFTPGTMAAFAQTAPATTQISDTVYNADGSAATGTVLISWPAFSTGAGVSVAAGSTAITIGTGGTLSVQLVANAGSTPMGSYYTVVYHLGNGSVTREYWVVPVSTATVAVSAIRSTVLPASVAMQTVSKSYVDTAIAAAVTGTPLDSSPYVQKAGDTMSGALVLPGDPTAPLQASDKNYVDEQTAGVTSGLNQKVSLSPSATQTVSQPPGTELAVNSLNQVQYASQYASGAGNNGIANATAAAACSSGCEVQVERTYPDGEVAAPATWNNRTHVDDRRGGSTTESSFNPLPPQSGGFLPAKSIDLVSTQSAQSVLAATGSPIIVSSGLAITSNALAGGSNVYPKLIQGTVPYFKTTYSGLNVTGNNNTLGQHVLVPESQSCFGVGDCLLGGMFLTASGGFRDDADEGTHPFDRVFTEDTRVFTGTCNQGCTSGSTSVTIAGIANYGTQGEGRYLVDTNPAKAITAGSLTGGSPLGGRQPSATFGGTSFPVSVFLETAQTIPTRSNSISPGTVTVPIVTSGVPSGFATNTAALPATSGVACVSDVAVADGRPLNFETAAYTVVDGSHLQMVLNRPHATGATLAVGGLCGYGLEQIVDTANGIRQVFPVIGTTSATSLLYAGGQTAIVGVQGLTSAYANVTAVVASISRTGNVVTLTATSSFPVDLNGLTVKVQSVADASYNGSFAVTTTGPNTLTYASTGPDSTSTGGSLSFVTGAYGLYPMAEVLSVYNTTTKAVDGQLTLAANAVAWAAGDTVEEPHYFQEKVNDDTDGVTQFTPRSTSIQSAGIYYGGNNGPGLLGWQIQNGDPASSYFGNGGTHTAPSIGMNLLGVWNHSMELEAGESTAFQVHCNSHGCGRWNSTYDLFDLDSATGEDRIRYSPSASTLDYYLSGTDFNFAPTGFTAGTINVTTLNAGSVHGLFLGTVGASSLPVFGGSGSSHQIGAVPDPGATAGTTRFLREDGTWATASGGAGAVASVNGQTGTVVITPASIGAAPGQAITPGAIADYNYTVSGSTLIDATGNNNGTLVSGSSPTPLPVGMAFSPYTGINLPAALNSAQTILFSVYINPLGSSNNGQPGVGDANLIGNSVGWASFNFYLMGQYPLGGVAQGAYGPGVYDAGPVTTPVASTSGYHVFALVRGVPNGSGGCATLDHIYVDGVEYAAYGAQGCSANEQASGNLIIGSLTGSGIPGTAYRTVFYAGQLTPLQVAASSNVIRNQDISRGVVTAPQPQPIAVGALNVIGDSITYGFNASGSPLTPYSSLLSLTNATTTGVNNWGISGITMFAISGSEANRVGPLCKSASGPAVASVFTGTNDFLNISGSTPQSVFGSLTSEIQTLKGAGCRVGVVTMISRRGNGNGNGGAAYDTDKNAYNALILSGARAAGADFIVDAAANPNLGADGANANTTYFQSDGIHPTQLGQQQIANAFSNSYNYTFGHNKANPNIVTGATYQMLSGDGAVSLAGTGAQAVKMPDCTGPSGAIYYLNNSTSAAKTVTGGTGQPINGLTTAISIPAYTSLALFDVPNPETSSGCHWEY